MWEQQGCCSANDRPKGQSSQPSETLRYNRRNEFKIVDNSSFRRKPT